MNKNIETQIIEDIRKSGFRATKTRIALLMFLKKSKYPVDIKQIMIGIGAKNIDQVTVYRILGNFKKAGIVNQLDFKLGKPLFEFKDENHDHHHIVCVECKKVEDFDGCSYKKLASIALKQASQFQTVTSHIIELFGQCKKCFKKQNTLKFAN